MEPINLTQPLFEAPVLNIEFIFEKIFAFLKPIFYFIIDPHTWSVIGIISILSSIFFLTILIFSLVRLREMQLEDKKEIDYEIKKALKKERDKSGNENSKWKNILYLSESISESDWRISIIEADLLLEEGLKEKGLTGNSLGELLDSAKGSGYTYLQNAWRAHLIRNQIAHEGAKFPLSKVETRRIIKLYEDFLKEIEIL